jgi:hypothetical protein
MSAYDVACEKHELICKEILLFLEESGVAKERYVSFKYNVSTRANGISFFVVAIHSN